jgi:hypothetical protein
MRIATTLDLLVFVPIERPDRMGVPDAPKLRRRVDRILHELLVDGGADVALPVAATVNVTEVPGAAFNYELVWQP